MTAPADAFIEAIAERVVEKLGAREPASGEVWLTVQQAAEHIQRDYHKVYRLVREEEIPSYRPSERCIRIAKSELDRWMRGHRFTREAW